MPHRHAESVRGERDGGHDARGRIEDIGWRLEREQRARAVRHDEIGESAADVDADPPGRDRGLAVAADFVAGRDGTHCAFSMTGTGRAGIAPMSSLV